MDELKLEALMASLTEDLLTEMSHKLNAHEVSMGEMLQVFQMLMAYVTPMVKK
jgi:hypothetical protein